MPDDSKRDVADLNVSELRARAAELEITGRSSMNKDELLQAVSQADGQAEGDDSGDADEWTPRETHESGEPGRADDGEKPANEIPAPSIGPNTVIEKESAEERLAKHDQSDTDAMGLAKRRGVVGEKHGASFAKRATVYGVFLAVVVALAIGGKLAVDDLDQGPAVNEDQAPWAGNERQPSENIDSPQSVTP